MPHYSAHEICHKEDHENKNNKISKNKEFLEAPSNNVKMQSDKTLTTQIKFLLTMQQMDVFLNETR